MFILGAGGGDKEPRTSGQYIGRCSAIQADGSAAPRQFIMSRGGLLTIYIDQRHFGIAVAI